MLFRSQNQLQQQLQQQPQHQFEQYCSDNPPIPKIQQNYSNESNNNMMGSDTVTNDHLINQRNLTSTSTLISKHQLQPIHQHQHQLFFKTFDSLESYSLSVVVYIVIDSNHYQRKGLMTSIVVILVFNDNNIFNNNKIIKNIKKHEEFGKEIEQKEQESSPINVNRSLIDKLRTFEALEFDQLYKGIRSSRILVKLRAKLLLNLVHSKKFLKRIEIFHCHHRKSFTYQASGTPNLPQQATSPINNKNSSNNIVTITHQSELTMSHNLVSKFNNSTKPIDEKMVFRILEFGVVHQLYQYLQGRVILCRKVVLVVLRLTPVNGVGHSINNININNNNKLSPSASPRTFLKITTLTITIMITFNNIKTLIKTPKNLKKNRHQKQVVRVEIEKNKRKEKRAEKETEINREAGCLNRGCNCNLDCKDCVFHQQLINLYSIAQSFDCKDSPTIILNNNFNSSIRSKFSNFIQPNSISQVRRSNSKDRSGQQTPRDNQERQTDQNSNNNLNKNNQNNNNQNNNNQNNNNQNNNNNNSNNYNNNTPPLQQEIREGKKRDREKEDDKEDQKKRKTQINRNRVGPSPPQQNLHLHRNQHHNQQQPIHQFSVFNIYRLFVTTRKKKRKPTKEPGKHPPQRKRVKLKMRLKIIAISTGPKDLIAKKVNLFNYMKKPLTQAYMFLEDSRFNRKNQNQRQQ
ncbi:hypothetical protein ACTFIU_006313 [Dictyostelium citrinum]